MYLNFNKLVLIFIINQKYKDFNNWTYMIHNCRTVMLISLFSDARSNKSDMWKYNGTSLCLPKTLTSHGTSTTVVSKVVEPSTNVATGSLMEKFVFFCRDNFVLGSCYLSTNKQIIKFRMSLLQLSPLMSAQELQHHYKGPSPPWPLSN